MLTDHEINPIWTDDDRAAIAELAAAKGLSPNIVIREALRLYQTEYFEERRAAWKRGLRPTTAPPSPQHAEQ